MKYVLLFCVLMLILNYTQAQVDSIVTPPPVHYPQPVPGQESDIKEDRIEVDRNQIPPTMQETLSENPIYEGWENGNIYFERNSDQFLVHIIRENSTQTFHFDKEGNAIRSEKALDPQESNH